MLRILLSGDQHIGRDYSSLEREDSAAAERLKAARLTALTNSVRAALEYSCDYFVIAGDLFDKKEVPKELVSSVCLALSECAVPVIVIPGNHDFFAGEDDALWRKFKECAADNTVLLSSPCAYATERAVFYPCPCESRYSAENALGWLRDNAERDENRLNIGIAHGALEGLSCDREKRYFSMTEEELASLDMDLWLIGHTHIPFPDGDKIESALIFNAGTHQQTDIADNAEGSVFVIDADKSGASARRVKTGVVSFARLSVSVISGEGLFEALERAIPDAYGKSSVVRAQISGIVSDEDYAGRMDIYARIRERLLRFEVFDDGLREEITEEMIDEETLEGTVENRLLKRYLGSPRLLETAFMLIKRVKEDE